MLRHPSRFFRFLKSNRYYRKIFIFDLDKTLWDHTIETSPTISSRTAVENYIHKDRLKILEAIQNDGHSLHIASRSSEREKCIELLDLAFPTITFQTKEIFPTPEWKREHFANIIPPNHTDVFYYFDDELSIIKNIKAFYPNCVPFHVKGGLHSHIF
jgi:hypothetical protein